MRPPVLGCSILKVTSALGSDESYVDKGRLGEKTGDGFFTRDEREALRERHKAEHYQVVEEATGA